MAATQNFEQLIRRMLDLNARKQVEEPDETAMIESIEACVEWVQACTACADDDVGHRSGEQVWLFPAVFAGVQPR